MCSDPTQACFNVRASSRASTTTRRAASVKRPNCPRRMGSSTCAPSLFGSLGAFSSARRASVYFSPVCAIRRRTAFLRARSSVTRSPLRPRPTHPAARSNATTTRDKVPCSIIAARAWVESAQRTRQGAARTQGNTAPVGDQRTLARPCPRCSTTPAPPRAFPRGPARYAITRIDFGRTDSRAAARPPPPANSGSGRPATSAAASGSGSVLTRHGHAGDMRATRPSRRRA